MLPGMEWVPSRLLSDTTKPLPLKMARAFLWCVSHARLFLRGYSRAVSDIPSQCRPCTAHTRINRPRSSAKKIRGGYLPFRLCQKSFYLECQRQPHNRAMLNSVDLEVIPAAAGLIVQPNSAIAQDGCGVFPKIIAHYAHGVPRVG